MKRLARLDEVCDVILGQSPPGDTYNTEGVGLPFYQGKTEFGEMYPTPRKWCSDPKKIAQPGDVLISVRAPVGPTNICPAESAIGRGLAALRPKSGLPSKYILYAVRASVSNLSRLATGSTFEAINGDQLKAHRIVTVDPTAAVALVEQIEDVLSLLDAGVESMQAVQEKLKTYRASVLKAACEGRLVPTEAELARQEGRDYETGPQLLTRILEARRQSWSGKGKYKEPSDPEIAVSDVLPLGWVFANFGQISEISLGKMLDKAKHKEGNLLPYLRNINIRWRHMEVSDLSQMYFRATEVERYSVKKGDLLVCEGGEPGRAAIWNRDEEIMYQKALHRVRPLNGVLAEYLLIYLEHVAKHGALAKMFTGSTIKHFPKEAFLDLGVQLPPFAEQIRIVAEVERRLSVIDQLEATVTANLQRATRLRQSILQKAFSPAIQSVQEE